jgi:hypothetical protein
MLARTLILVGAGFVVAAGTRVLIRTRHERKDKLSREEFKNVRKLEEKLNRRTTAKD